MRRYLNFFTSGTGSFGPAIILSDGGPSGSLFQQSFSNSTPTRTIDLLPSTVGPNTHRIFGGGGCGGCSTGASYTYSWQLDFSVIEVAAVPLPAAGWLLLVSLFGMVGFGRGKRA